MTEVEIFLVSSSEANSDEAGRDTAAANWGTELLAYMDGTPYSIVGQRRLAA